LFDKSGLPSNGRKKVKKGTKRSAGCLVEKQKTKSANSAPGQSAEPKERDTERSGQVKQSGREAPRFKSSKRYPARGKKKMDTQEIETTKHPKPPPGQRRDWPSKRGMGGSKRKGFSKSVGNSGKKRTGSHNDSLSSGPRALIMERGSQSKKHRERIECKNKGN